MPIKARDKRPQDVPTAAERGQYVADLARHGYTGQDLADVVRSGRTWAEISQALIEKQRRAPKGTY